MAKQKRNLSRNYKIPTLIERFLTKDEINLFDIPYSEETKVKEVEYYKNQSDNYIFLSAKEDLVKLIKNDYKVLVNSYKAEDSIYKKEIIKDKLIKFKKINLNFNNTWESFEVTKLIYNNGDILDESEIRELRKKQKLIREKVKRALVVNKFAYDKFASRYGYVIQSVIMQLFVIPLIECIIYFITDPYYSWDFMGYISIYLYWVIISAFAYPIKFFVMEKLITLTISSESSKNENANKKLKRDYLSLIGSIAALSFIKRIFSKHKD